MICPLYTLAQKYQNKSIYVWNINRTSIVLFTKVAFMGINIQGFAVSEEKYVGEKYLNRPVVALSEIQNDEESIILLSNDVPIERVNMIPKDKVVYWSEALEFNKSFGGERLIIYGTGYGADKIEELLGESGKEAELYCVTERKGAARHKGKRVIEAAELGRYSDYTVIISAKREKDRKEILDTLSDFPGKIYAEHIIDEVAFLHLNLFQYLDLAAKEHKEVYIYGRKTQIAKHIEEMLSLYGINCSGYVYENEDEEQNVSSIYTMALNGIENKLVIISEILPSKFIEARKNVELSGFSLDQGNYSGFQWYTASDDNLLDNFKQTFDPLVGFSLLYPQGKAGWRVYGKEKENDIKILVLGGSTSSEVYHPENWVSKLYFRLKKENYNVTVYNGAHTADDIVDEVLRLLRDGNVLCPHIVISMSGVNNLTYKKSSNQFNETRTLSWVHSMAKGKVCGTGVDNEESLYFFWERNQRLLKTISGFYGASFVGFLQPMNITMNQMDLWEKSVYEVEHALIGAADYSKYACSNDEYINLMSLFAHQKERYVDHAHYTDQAHEIIADKVYEAIAPVIQKINGEAFMR